MNKRQRKKQSKKAENVLWEKLKHLGGNKSDSYAQVLEPAHVDYSIFKKGDYARVRELFEPKDQFTWLQNRKEREEQLLCASWGVENSGIGEPHFSHQFKIIWKDGKPV